MSFACRFISPAVGTDVHIGPPWRLAGGCGHPPLHKDQQLACQKHCARESASEYSSAECQTNQNGQLTIFVIAFPFSVILNAVKNPLRYAYRWTMEILRHFVPQNDTGFWKWHCGVPRFGSPRNCIQRLADPCRGNVLGNCACHCHQE